MLQPLARARASRRRGPAGDVAGAVLDRMTDATVSQFVVRVGDRRSAAPSDRLAQAFQALVPDTERPAAAARAGRRPRLSASELGKDADDFAELWKRVESLLTSYSDKTLVSDEYGARAVLGAGAGGRRRAHQRRSARAHRRMAGDGQRRGASGARHQLLVDLLVIEKDPLRWRDVADTVMRYADDLVRVGRLRSGLASRRHGRAGIRKRMRHAARSALPALDRFGRGVDDETRGCAPAQRG